MEVMAVLQALQAIRGPVIIISDSTYVVNCFRQEWWRGWLARGWRNSKGGAVANQDLWKPLLAEVGGREPQVTFRWVKGHAGDRMNAFVDQLAVEAASAQVGRSTSESS
jgi:ribonuclease HI